MDFFPQPLQKLTFARPRGCEKCRGLGYRGRTGIFEIFRVTLEVKELVIKRASEGEIVEVALSQGMRTLQESGILKVIKKITSLQEVGRVTFVKKV